MRTRKLLLGALGGLVVAASAAFLPRRDAQAQTTTTWNCFTTRQGGECGCADCWLNNCTCPKKPPADNELTPM